MCQSILTGGEAKVRILLLEYVLSSAVVGMLGLGEHGRDGGLSSSTSNRVGVPPMSIATGHVIAMRLSPKLCPPYVGVLDSG